MSKMLPAYSKLLRHKALPQAEERSLIAKAQQGCIVARDKLVMHNMRLIAHVCKHYATAAQPERELYGIGIEAFMECIKKFDLVAYKDKRIAVIAKKAIHGALIRSKELNTTAITIPPYVRQAHHKISKLLDNLNVVAYTYAELVEIIYTELKIEKSVINAVLKHYDNMAMLTSLDYTQENKVDLHDVIADTQDDITVSDTHMDLQRILSCLNDLQREIVEVRWGLRKAESQEAMGKRLGMSVGKLRMIYNRAMAQMQSYAKQLTEGTAYK